MKLKPFLLYITFPITLLFISGSPDIETYGRCSIIYGDNNLINNIETMDDGWVYYNINESKIHVYPNSNIDISGDKIVLNKGMVVFSNTLHSDEKIKTDMFFDSIWGGCRFFRIGVPSVNQDISGQMMIRYHLPDKKIDIAAKIHHVFDSKQSNTSYYGFFIPLFPSWKTVNFDIELNLFENNSPYCMFKYSYDVSSKEWQKQKILFQQSKSTQLKNINQNQYEAERKERTNIFDENNTIMLLEGGFGYPFNNSIPISSEMGFIREWRLSNGKLYSVDVHLGLDIVKKKNTEIHASADGIVRYAKYGQYVGNTAIIEHGMSLFSEYCHMNKILVKPGDKIKKGDVIGLVGMTGAATGPHLHWETRVYNIPVDPRSFLNIDYIFKE